MTNKKKEGEGMRAEGRGEWRGEKKGRERRRRRRRHFLLGEKRLTLMNTSLQTFFLKKAHCCNTPGTTRIPLVIKPIPLIYLHMAPPEKSVLTATRDTHPIPQPFVRRRTPFGRVLCVNAWLL